MSADELVKHSVKGKAQQMDAALELLRRKSNRIARRSAA
jgi:hypothetical protein